MKRRIGLLAPLGAAVVALACLLAFQAAVPPVTLAKPPSVGTIANGDPTDGEHRQFTDEVRLTKGGTQLSSASPAPTAPDESRTPSPEVRSQSQTRRAWASLVMKELVRQAMQLVMGW